jgi:DNA primase
MPQKTIERNMVVRRIQDAIDIVNLVSEYVELKKAGRNYKALCPFHREKTPSFIVSPDKQIFHCFGCGEGGDIFSFLMKKEAVSFPEALRILAERAGISIGNLKPGADTETELLFRASEQVCDYFQESLKSYEGQRARRYLEKRGIKKQTIEKFSLGFCPYDSKNITRYCYNKKIKIETLEKLGILQRGTGGKNIYLRFRNRLIFPIFNLRGKVIGFGGRVCDSSLPKYLNSPDIPIYRKGNNLYGLNFSKGYLREKGQVIVVEGYLDLISLWQAGIYNVVASLGTSLTLNQINLLHRYTKEVIIGYDADPAGEKAVLRSLESILEEGLRVRVLNLPKGKDPDEVIKKEGREKFMALVNSAESLFDYKYRILKRECGSSKIEEKIKIAENMFSIISKVDNIVERNNYIKNLAERLNLSEEALNLELEKKIKKDTSSFKFTDIKTTAEIEQNSRQKAEKELLELILEEERLINTVKKELSLNDITDSDYRHIFSLIFKSEENSRKEIMLQLKDNQKALNKLSALTINSIDVKDKEKAVVNCIKKINRAKIKERKKALQQQIKEASKAENKKMLDNLLKEYQELS